MCARVHVRFACMPVFVCYSGIQLSYSIYVFEVIKHAYFFYIIIIMSNYYNIQILYLWGFFCFVLVLSSSFHCAIFHPPFRPLMKKKLEQGITLVVDRYAFSGVAFTSAKPVSTKNLISLELLFIYWLYWLLEVYLTSCVLFRTSLWSGVRILMWVCQSQTL